MIEILNFSAVYFKSSTCPEILESFQMEFSCSVLCVYVDRNEIFVLLTHCRRTRSQSCPFCRDSLKRVNSGDLWVYTDSKDIVDMATVMRENLRRLFIYIDKLPLVIPDNLFDPYDSHLR